MTFIGPAILASMAASTDNETTARALLKEAETILDSGCVAHNHIWFARTSIGYALNCRAWDLVERYSARLETYTRNEPLPWSDFIIAEGRALSCWQRGQRNETLATKLQHLLGTAVDRGLLLDVALLSKTLASA